MPFVLMQAPGGKRMLVNMDVTFCYVEAEDGKADAVSIAGMRIPTGETFEMVMAEMGEVEPEE